MDLVIGEEAGWLLTSGVPCWVDDCWRLGVSESFVGNEGIGNRLA